MNKEGCAVRGGMLTWINLTNWCDLYCSWCYASSVKSWYFMNNEIFEKILVFLEDIGAHRVLFSGGEPTLHPDFFSMIKRCKNRSLKVMVNTNGLAFADRLFLRRAADNGLSLINLSLKAINSDDFIVYAGVDGFSRQKEAVRNILADHRLALTVNLMLSRYFMANFDQALGLLKDWGVKCLVVDLARPIQGVDPFGGGQIPLEEEAVDFVADSIFKLSDSGLDYLLRLDVPLCRFIGKKSFGRLAQMNFMTNCFLRDGNALVFNPDGGIIPCNILTETVLGRIGQDFSTAKEYDKFLRRSDVASILKSLRVEDKPECKDCPLAVKCCRGCSAFKMAEKKIQFK